MSPSDPRPVTLGTAGHIDHGKTSLVKALTGVDTDRLREEKERGITIELGFARLDLPGGVRLSIVDVPGHERFVKNMVAGATGIDLVLLVVAADEGVMPQTREHLEICTLLGVGTGLVALTKSDMVDDELLELAREDVLAEVEGSFLEGAPIVPISSTTGAGLDELVARLDEVVSRVPSRGGKGLFRLPVDRVFTMRGFGTVVTGTLLSGAVRTDDEVTLLPSERTAKVRGIQVHGETRGRATAGQRVALNLSGIDVTGIARGDTVIHPGSLKPTRMVDVRLDLLSSAPRPLKDRARVRLHVGTQEVPVVGALLEHDVLRPGETGWAQLRSAEWFTACPGDRFVLRAFSPARTLGGGVVLDHRPRRHRGRRAGVAERLEVLHGGEPNACLKVVLENRGVEGLTPQDAQAALGVPLEKARTLLQGTVRSGAAMVTDRRTQRHHHRATVDSLGAEALDILTRHHAEHPLKRGLGTEELRSKFPRYLNPRLVEFVLEGLEADGRVVFDGDVVRRADFTLRLSADDKTLRARILDAVESKGYRAPTGAEVAAAVGEPREALAPVLDFLVTDGVLVRTKEGFLYPATRLATLVSAVVARLDEKGEIGVADIKEVTGTTRKHTIPLLEFLDSNRITVRKGDVRVAGPRARG